jgi:hypothetical protein
MRRLLFLASFGLLGLHCTFVAGKALAPNLAAVFAPLLWAAIPVAALVVAVLARSRQFTTGLLVSVPAAVLFVLSNAAIQLLGQSVEFPGFRGALFVFGLSLPAAMLLSAIGAGVARLSPFQPV